VTVLFVDSHYGTTEPLFDQADFAGACGLITTMHLDQIGFMEHAASVRSLLDRGGCWVFNGHMLRALVPGLGIYVPLQAPHRADYALTRLGEHPVFAGIDQKALEENRGVAGFYGRGHNPLPPGAAAINGIGPQRLPIDWDWALPNGGHIFSHAGNDFWGSGDDDALKQVIADRSVAWASGGLGR
jgi:hypothetical protein